VSLNKSTNTRRVIVQNAAGRRKTIYLGTASERDAESFAGKVQEIVNATVMQREPSREVVQWIAGLPTKLRKKLERVGLISKREREVETVADLFKAYFDTLNVEPGTLVTYLQTERALLSYIGKSRHVADVSALDAERWKQAMAKDGLAGPTISRRIKTARRVFARAVRWKLIDGNPFDDVKTTGESNSARLHFITPDVAQKVLDACPDAEWRLIFALSRFGGLRCPSEHLNLKWSDVLWDQKKIRIQEHKTSERWLPMFPELEKELLDVFSTTMARHTHIITRYRLPNINLRTQLLRILHKAGVSAWPKLFHNLRATRQTELAERFPIHVVCAWIGNSEKIARKHYLSVMDHHYEAATMSPTKNDAPNDADSVGHARTAADISPRGTTKNAVPVSGTALSDDPDGITEISIAPRVLRGSERRDAQYDALSHSERMRRALALIDANFNLMNDEGGRN
jgi:integrase